MNLNSGYLQYIDLNSRYLQYIDLNSGYLLYIDGIFWKAGIASENSSDQLLIALEPEAASIYVRRLRLYQLLPETPLQSPPNEISTGSNRSTSRPQSGTVSTSSQRRSMVGGTEPGSPRRLSFIGTESTSFSTFGRSKFFCHLCTIFALNFNISI